MYLIHFSHSYLEHRLPELDSLLILNGIQKENVYNMYFNLIYFLFSFFIPFNEVSEHFKAKFHYFNTNID